MTKVSVITISYNNAKGLYKTIKSVVEQDFEDYEYIVIDGGSDDNSKDVISQFSDKITYWVSEPDKGVYHAMNKGIVASKGQFLHFLNSGDIYKSGSILSTVFSEQHLYPLIRTVQICDYGDHTKRWDNLGNKEVTLYDMFMNTMLHQATFIHRNLFDKYGLYDENLKVVSDWKFFLKAILGGEKTEYIDLETVIFEMDGISTNKSYGELHLNERNLVLNQLMPPNTINDYKRLHELEKGAYIERVMTSNIIYFSIFKCLNKTHKLFNFRKKQ